MFEVTVDRPADEMLTECVARGLIVKLETFERTRGGARHWHLGYPKQPGVLELTDLGERTSLRVADRRDGGWATEFARDLAR